MPGFVENVNKVAQGLTPTFAANVETVAENILDVNAVAADIVDVAIVADNINAVVAVGPLVPGLTTIVTNITEILAADDNATIATTQAGIATTQATAAATSASTATTKAAEANNSASSASGSAASALVSAVDAEDAATAAGSSASAASLNAASAAASALSASTSASNAAMSEDNAGLSETAAAASATSAGNSATTAVASATTATTKASEATASAVSASTSASNAASSATNAANSASAANTSATAAANSATLAGTSASAAANSATEAASLLDQFDDRYLGSRASDPLTDNDGNTLLVGALYYNTTTDTLKIWTGSVWNPAAFDTTGAVASFNTRTGAVTLLSSDVTTALGYTPEPADVTIVKEATTDTLTNKTIDSITNKVGADHIHYPVRNVSGSTIAAGTVVTAQGTQSGTDYVEVVPVTNPQTQIALGILYNTIANNGTGLCMNTGVSADQVDTSGWAVGTILYPNNTGGLTSTKPTSGHYQACAVVLRSHANQGTLLVEFTEPKYIASTTQAGYVQLNDTLTSTSTTQALTAAQGKVLQDGKEPAFVKNTGFNKNFGTTAGTVLEGNHYGSTGSSHGIASTSVNGFMSSADKTKLDGIASSAEVNQNAFSNIAVSGQTTIAADSKTDTLTLVAGTNVSITTDAVNDTITISANDASVDWTEIQNKPDPTITLAGDATGSVTLTDVGNGTLTVTVVDDSHNHVISNVDGLQTALDGKQPIDATLTALAGVTTAADKVIYATASDTFTTTTLSSFGRSLIDDANAAAALTTLGAASSSHVHGDISNTGTISTAAVTPASTDYLLLADASNSNKIQRGVAIGTSTTTYLRNDGTWATPPDTNTTYSLATASVLGLVKLGSDTVQSTAPNTVTTTASRSYAIQANASGQMVVNVPWTDTVYSLPASVVHDTEPSALHATDALRVSGTTLSLYKGDGSFESVTTQDTIYTHPTTDGSLHVPATGTTNSGKVLKAGGTAGSAAWETMTASDVGALPTSGGAMSGAITAIRETKVAMATDDIDLAAGNLFTKTITAATTFTVSNVLGSGNANSFILELTNAGSQTITWMSGVKWAGGIAPVLTLAGVDILGFYSHDGGATWRAMVLAKDSK